MGASSAAVIAKLSHRFLWAVIYVTIGILVERTTTFNNKSVKSWDAIMADWEVYAMSFLVLLLVFILLGNVRANVDSVRHRPELKANAKWLLGMLLGYFVLTAIFPSLRGDFVIAPPDNRSMFIKVADFLGPPFLFLGVVLIQQRKLLRLKSS